MRYIFILILLIGISNELKASHAMGGELTYKCVGGNSFVFELAFYRDTAYSVRLYNEETD
jgi:hypothetical protein